MRKSKVVALLLLALLLFVTGCAAEEAEIPVNTVTAESQKVEFYGIKNARELGGYYTAEGTVIKEGLLIRTAALDHALEEDFEAIVDEYNVAHVIDMRGSFEVGPSPEPMIPGTEAHWVKIMDEETMAQRAASVADVLLNPNTNPVDKIKASMEADIVTDQMYVEFLSSQQGREGYQEFFRILLDNEEGDAILWHCTNGKDRTGVAAMLLLDLLKVDRETIMKDYLLTNEFFADEISAMMAMFEGQIPEDQMEDALVGGRGVAESYLQNAMDYIDDNYGSTEEYAKAELGLTDEDILKLAELYTE